MSAKIELDDPFMPKKFSYEECGKKIDFMITCESIHFQFSKDGEHIIGMRLPLYASISLAQVLTGTLNGNRFLK